jgi:hypothetical protein
MNKKVAVFFVCLHKVERFWIQGNNVEGKKFEITFVKNLTPSKTR